jgi:hypothetical protein
MLTERDIQRLTVIFELDRQGLMSEVVQAIAADLRQLQVGQKRDPLKTPFVEPTRSIFTFLYQPPAPPTKEEILYALFPSERMQIADDLLAGTLPARQHQLLGSQERRGSAGTR